jgi:hypothetical protein
MVPRDYIQRIMNLISFWQPLAIGLLTPSDRSEDV